MSVTDGDRERAAVLMDAWDVDDGATYLDLAVTIAAALAEERAKARAPFLALAEKWEADAQRNDDAEPVNSDGLTRMILAARFLRMARRIRRAAEVTE